jgi:hypothetical protein
MNTQPKQIILRFTPEHYRSLYTIMQESRSFIAGMGNPFIQVGEKKELLKFVNKIENTITGARREIV